MALCIICGTELAEDVCSRCGTSSTIMSRERAGGIGILLILVYVLVVLAIWLLVRKFSPTEADWVMPLLVAVEAVALVGLAGFAVVHRISRVGSVRPVIQRMVPTQLYEIIKTGHILKVTPLIVILLVITFVGSIYTASYLPEERRNWLKFEGLPGELNRMQTAMVAMMVDRNLTTVDEHTTGPAVNDWTLFPTGTGVVPLGNVYADLATSTYYYCWDARGEVYPRSDDPDVAKMPGECLGKSMTR